MPEEEVYDYDVAVSFAGEDRSYVKEVVSQLKRDNINVFYDEDDVSEIWGQNLVDFLQAIYGRRARFAVIFVSRHYIEKKWTNHERQSAQDRALQQSSPYILPVRLDDSELPGLHSTTAYLDARSIGIEGIVAALKGKLTTSTSPTAPQFDHKVPRTSEAISTVLSERPEGWEYLLFAGMLLQGIDELEPKYRDHLIEYSTHNGQVLDDADAIAFIRSRFTSVTSILANIMRILSPEAKLAAFGAPGEPGDPDRIIHLANRVISVYSELMDWSAALRATGIIDEDLRGAAEIEARMTTLPLQQIRDVVNNMVTELDRLEEKLRDEEAVNLTFYLNLDVDDALQAEFSEIMKKYYVKQSRN